MSNPIGWCDKTWNPITGCSPISPACDHCYAERMSKRLAGRFGYPADEPFRVTSHWSRLADPERWKKPQWVFVCSMGDLFHERVPLHWVEIVFGAISCAPQHTFLLLTKRPERMRDFMDQIATAYRYEQGIGFADWPPPNVYLGVTVEDQDHIHRVDTLATIPAVRTFVSHEPLLGPIDYTGHVMPSWVICGPENGPGKRPMDLDWARSLRDQCAAAGVPFWYKAGLLDGVEHKERVR